MLTHTLIILELLIAQELLTQPAAPVVSIKEMIITADPPWAEQKAVVFGAA